jgi:hypothetical protein
MEVRPFKGELLRGLHRDFKAHICFVFQIRSLLHKLSACKHVICQSYLSDFGFIRVLIWVFFSEVKNTGGSFAITWKFSVTKLSRFPPSLRPSVPPSPLCHPHPHNEGEIVAEQSYVIRI